jgi:hypothetical protein
VKGDNKETKQRKKLEGKKKEAERSRAKSITEETRKTICIT